METFVKIGNSKIWTVQSGKGMPCILCNGGPGCDDYLGPVSGMIEDTCQTIRFEPRGCGRSDYDGLYDITTTIGDVEEIRQHFGFEQVLVGGHSAGVDVALAYAIQHPDRVTAIFGIAGGRIVNDRDWSAEYKSKLQDMGEDLGGKVFKADPKVNEIGNRSWREYIKREGLLHDIAAIECPALFICAGSDIRPNWPTKQISRLIKNGKYIEIPGAPHQIWLTHGENLRAELSKFISSLLSVH